MRSSGPIAGEPLSPLQSDEDAPVSKWMEDAALSRAQAIRHGADDWEPQLGDGRKQNARHSIDVLSGDRSPRFEMPGMDVRRSSARYHTSVEPRRPALADTPRRLLGGDRELWLVLVTCRADRCRQDRAKDAKWRERTRPARRPLVLWYVSLHP